MCSSPTRRWATIFLPILDQYYVNLHSSPNFGPGAIRGQLPGCTITGAGRIIGTEGDDVICGSEQAEQIFGNGGDDNVYGRGGVDSSTVVRGTTCSSAAPRPTPSTDRAATMPRWR